MKIRQGDVMFTAIERLPDGPRKVRENATVAYGEVTGHSHALAVEDRDIAEVIEIGDGLYVQVSTDGMRLGNRTGARFVHEVVGLQTQTDPLDGLTELAKHAGWFQPHENICFVSERHNILRRDERGRLHCADGPAVGYPDGWSIYAWHGTRIPERYYTADMGAADILAEENAEVRRALIERYDESRERGQWLIDVDAKVLDTAIQPNARFDGPAVNELLSIELPGDPDGRMTALNVIDPSTGRRYILRVPPDQTTVKGAVAWTFNVPEEQYVLEQES